MSIILPRYYQLYYGLKTKQLSKTAIFTQIFTLSRIFYHEKYKLFKTLKILPYKFPAVDIKMESSHIWLKNSNTF